MANPFRQQAQGEMRPQVADTVRDAVEQMVRQFADPLAFLRELVQNSLDAGTTRIDVRLEFDPEGGEDRKGQLRVHVSDDGAGMNLEAVERCLLVLFRSSKDGDSSKIGKFGVGFFSVFAVGPTEVIVDTGTGPEGLRVLLRPDYSYEVEQSAPRKGTTVTVKVPVPPDEAAGFTRRCAEALQRWCPHVAVPLHFAALGVGIEGAGRVLNLAFEPEGALGFVHTDPDGTRFSIALDARGGMRFYNRGILLHATDEALAPGVSLRIDSPHLGHTISRDNVRRDAHFERLLRQATELCMRQLRELFLSALRTEAERAGAAFAAGAAPENPAYQRFRSLCSVAMTAPFRYDRSELTFPLAAPLPTPTGPRHSAPPRAPLLYAPLGDPLAPLLAARGTPVFALDAAPASVDGDPWRTLLLFASNSNSAAASSAWGAPGLVNDNSLAAAELALLVALRSSLRAVGVPAVAFARPSGLCGMRLAIVLEKEQLEWSGPALVLRASELDTALFGWLSKRGVALSLTHPRVRAALAAAPMSVALAATALARLVLLSEGKLDAERDRALFEHATALTVTVGGAR